MPMLPFDEDPTPLLRRPEFIDSSGMLVVTSEANDPFRVERTFLIRPNGGQVRGDHAHRSCSQFFIAVSGSFLIRLQVGRRVRELTLDGPDQGLLVRPMVWASETATSENSLLLVLCDEVFHPDEYIRDPHVFAQESEILTHGLFEWAKWQEI